MQTCPKSLTIFEKVVSKAGHCISFPQFVYTSAKSPYIPERCFRLVRFKLRLCDKAELSLPEVQVRQILQEALVLFFKVYLQLF